MSDYYETRKKLAIRLKSTYEELFRSDNLEEEINLDNIYYKVLVSFGFSKKNFAKLSNSVLVTMYPKYTCVHDIATDKVYLKREVA